MPRYQVISGMRYVNVDPNAIIVSVSDFIEFLHKVLKQSNPDDKYLIYIVDISDYADMHIVFDKTELVDVKATYKDDVAIDIEFVCSNNSFNTKEVIDDGIKHIGFYNQEFFEQFAQLPLLKESTDLCPIVIRKGSSKFHLYISKEVVSNE